METGGRCHTPTPFSLPCKFIHRECVQPSMSVHKNLVTFLNKLDKRISSLLPFPVTLLIDFLERKERSSVPLPQRAMLPQVFNAKQTTTLKKRTVFSTSRTTPDPPSAVSASTIRPVRHSYPEEGRAEPAPSSPLHADLHCLHPSPPSVSCPALPPCFGLVFCQWELSSL